MFGRSAYKDYNTRIDVNDFEWKYIEVNEITDSRELLLLIQWLTADHSTQDRTAIAVIEKIIIIDSDNLPDSQFKIEMLSMLDGADARFVLPSVNDGRQGIFAMNLATSAASVVLNQ